MLDRNITELIKAPQILESRDSVRRAAGLIRASDGTGLLVIQEGKLRGILRERAIAAHLGAADDPEKALDESIDSLIEEYPIFISSSASLREAAQVFATNGVDVLPVVDSQGRLAGVIYQRDIIGVFTKTLRPASVAGMATPLGVYLTTGSQSGGAGSLGLYLTGISLGLMIILGKVAAEGVIRGIGLLVGMPFAIWMRSTPLSLPALSTYDLPTIISTVLGTVFMLVMLRLSPLSGYHAAEHMTVHAIEAGEELTPDTVRRFPRVHPRCGTNLLAAASVFILITSEFGGQVSALIAVMIVILGWRQLGGWLQYRVTTRPPNERQLKNGVAAGNQLLQRYLERPNYYVTGFNRVWNMGFMQTGAGMMTMLYIAYLLATRFGLPFLQ